MFSWKITLICIRWKAILWVVTGLIFRQLSKKTKSSFCKLLALGCPRLLVEETTLDKNDSAHPLQKINKPKLFFKFILYQTTLEHIWLKNAENLQNREWARSFYWCATSKLQLSFSCLLNIANCAQSWILKTANFPYPKLSNCRKQTNYTYLPTIKLFINCDPWRKHTLTSNLLCSILGIRKSGVTLLIISTYFGSLKGKI